MGTDCTVIVELETDGFWNTIGMMVLPRNYEMFEKLRSIGHYGYPANVDHNTKHVLEDLECWGEGYMPYECYRKILKKYHMEDCNVIKKKLHPRCRVVYRFDN